MSTPEKIVSIHFGRGPDNTFGMGLLSLPDPEVCDLTLILVCDGERRLRVMMRRVELRDFAAGWAEACSDKEPGESARRALNSFVDTDEPDRGTVSKTMVAMAWIAAQLPASDLPEVVISASMETLQMNLAESYMRRNSHEFTPTQLKIDPARAVAR